MCVGHFEFTDLHSKFLRSKPKKHFLTIKCDFYFLVEFCSTHQSGNSLHFSHHFYSDNKHKCKSNHKQWQSCINDEQ